MKGFCTAVAREPKMWQLRLHILTILILTLGIIVPFAMWDAGHISEGARNIALATDGMAWVLSMFLHAGIPCIISFLIKVAEE